MKFRAAILVVVVVFQFEVMAQMSTEVPPSGRTVPDADQVEQEMATARFRLGPVRLLPFFEVYNVGWTNNALVTSEGEVDDYTASVTAGTRLVVPFGPRIYLRGNLAPSYDWYYRTEHLRHFGGSYSGEALGLFNRLTVSAGGSYDERVSSVSSEVGRDVLSTTTNGAAKVEVKVLERLFLFGGAAVARMEQEDPNANTPGLAPVSDLDRKETGYRGGVRYAYSPSLSLGVMGEEVETRFEENGELQDNDVTGLLFVARYDSERFYVEGTVGVREGKAVTPNEYFPEYREETYGYLVSYFVTHALEARVRGARRPVASLFLDNPYYFETRNGATLRLAFGRRLSFNAAVEMGSNRYVNPVLVTATNEIVTRVDDTKTVGGGFDFSVSRAVTIGLTVSQESWDSNIDYYDRSAFRIFGGLRVMADFGRAEERR